MMGTWWVAALREKMPCERWTVAWISAFFLFDLPVLCHLSTTPTQLLHGHFLPKKSQSGEFVIGEKETS